MSKNYLPSGAEKLFTAYQDKFPDRCHRVHYDTYAKDVHAFEPLFGFLGEPFDLKAAQEVMSTRLDHARGQGLSQTKLTSTNI